MSLLDKVVMRVARMTNVRPVASRLSQAMASFSFDDIPASAARVGAPILEAAGHRGTFYICGKHTGGVFESRQQHSLDDLKTLHRSGHELACHGYAHPDVRRIDEAGWQADIAANAAFISGQVGAPAPVSFAYPYGAVSIPAKRHYGSAFATARGVCAGVNAGQVDFSELLAIGLERRKFDLSRINSLIAQAKQRAGWLIFYSHDVGDDPTAYGCAPDQLQAVIAALKGAEMPVLPVAEAAQRVQFG
jgi:peptidoglycan/xylan/chitin deacetylase (PgdA/CDA1 family)